MQKETICAFAPATIANLSVGFDVLGLSLDQVGDTVEVTVNGSTENTILTIENGETLPKDREKNCCSVVIKKMQAQLNDYKGVDIRIRKGFKSGSGMGSSSASSAAAAYAYNALVGYPFSEQELVRFAAEGERVACGAAHADNVAPAIMGGLVLVRAHDPIDIISLPLPDGLWAVVLFPDVKINTEDSRAVMQKNISLNLACQQWANLGAFVASLYENDLELFSRSLQDFIAEPVRSNFIPKFQELKQIALQSGALGFGISGSGPSVFAIASNETAAHNIQENLLKTFENTGVDASCFVESLSGNQGARIIDHF